MGKRKSSLEKLEMIDSKFWQGKKVFITGHTGFKGGWLVHWLEKHGAKITGYSLPPPTDPSLFETTGVQGKLEKNIFGDVTDFENLSRSLLESQAQIVFHMAAQPLVRASYKNPIETYNTNVMGTVHVLEAVRKTSTVKSCVVVTTDKCYENFEWERGYTEEDRLGGHDPYSNSKACSELVTSAYLKSFFNAIKDVGVASARAGNVIGGGDFAEDRLVPDLYRCQKNTMSLVIRSPKSTRPWQHVLVPLSGYIDLAQRLYSEPKKFSEAFNFGPVDSDCISVEKVLMTLQKYWQKDLSIELEKTPQPHEAKLLKLDITKASRELSWKPTWSIEKTVEKTADWYKLFLSGENVLEITMKQIVDFEKEWLASGAKH